jgi:hypothetical protein
MLLNVDNSTYYGDRFLNVDNSSYGYRFLNINNSSTYIPVNIYIHVLIVLTYIYTYTRKQIYCKIPGAPGILVKKSGGLFPHPQLYCRNKDS